MERYSENLAVSFPERSKIHGFIRFEIPNEFKNAFQVQNLQGQKASVYFQNQAIFRVLF